MGHTNIVTPVKITYKGHQRLQHQTKILTAKNYLHNKKTYDY